MCIRDRLIVAVIAISSVVNASVTLKDASSITGAVFIIWMLEEDVHSDQSVPSFTRASMDQSSPFFVSTDSSWLDVIPVCAPFFNHRYSTSVMESMSASEDVMEAASESIVVGFTGLMVIESTTGGVFDVCPSTDTEVERVQLE